MTVRARFRRSAAGVLALYHSMNGELNAFEAAAAATRDVEVVVVEREAAVVVRTDGWCSPRHDTYYG